ncbi:MAG: GNAT family N-acetyltransferase [Defluviitaleaceae bacterium]|nr:GNAT family N-acetyltransferase [Defluviitaleaceae bacterium]
MITLETDRLIIRNYKPADLPRYHQMMSDTENMYFLSPFGILTHSMAASEESLAQAVAFNELGKGYRFCIATKADDQLIGGIGYEIAANTPVGKVADPMGWFLMAGYHNKGYITEAVKRLLAFAFLQDNCVRVATACFKDNVPTQKVMAKVGFRKEAEKRRAMWLNGAMRDRLEFAINRDEWET